MSTQKQIIRQSQIKIATEILREKNVEYTLLELIVLTESLTDYIHDGLVQNATKRIREVDNWLTTKTNNGI